MFSLVLNCAAGASLALYLGVFAWCAAHPLPAAATSHFVQSSQPAAADEHPSYTEAR